MAMGVARQGYPADAGVPVEPQALVTQPPVMGVPPLPNIHPPQLAEYPPQPGEHVQPAAYVIEGGGNPKQPHAHPYPPQEQKPAIPDRRLAHAPAFEDPSPADADRQHSIRYPPHVIENYGHGTVQASPMLDTLQDAAALRQAVKKWRGDKPAFVRILCARTNSQRQEIANKYKQVYGKDLTLDIKKKFHMGAQLLYKPCELDASELHRAISGFGSDRSILIEILTSRRNAEIRAMKLSYHKLYGNTLDVDIRSETSGCFRTLMTILCGASRDETSSLDGSAAEADAKKLQAAKGKKFGSESSAFVLILGQQNFSQLNLLCDEYKKLTKKRLKEDIEAEFQGDAKDGLLAIIAFARNRPAFFASRINHVLQARKTKDLIRLIISRSEIDLAEIKSEFERIYKKGFVDSIHKATSGAVREAIEALVTGSPLASF